MNGDSRNQDLCVLPHIHTLSTRRKGILTEYCDSMQFHSAFIWRMKDARSAVVVFKTQKNMKPLHSDHAKNPPYNGSVMYLLLNNVMRDSENLIGA